MTLALILPTPTPQSLADLAVLSLPSPHSRRVYSRHIAAFISSGEPLTREGVQRTVQRMRLAGKGAVTVNHAISAIRLLAREAYARGQVTDLELYAIETVKGVARRGTRLGNWLELGALRELLDAAGHGVNGRRNQALIAVMAGCGLRRSEVVSLTWTKFTRRSDRYVVEVLGKGDKWRTVPVNKWVGRYLEDWKLLAHACEPLIFAGLGAQGLYYVVQDAAQKAGLPALAPHDLRRTSARLARQGGATLEQISQSLGHNSVQTTERYVNSMLELREGMAAFDHINLPD